MLQDLSVTRELSCGGVAGCLSQPLGFQEALLTEHLGCGSTLLGPGNVLGVRDATSYSKSLRVL